MITSLIRSRRVDMKTIWLVIVEVITINGKKNTTCKEVAILLHRLHKWLKCMLILNYFFFFGLRRAHPSSLKSGTSPFSSVFGLLKNCRQSPLLFSFLLELSLKGRFSPRPFDFFSYLEKLSRPSGAFLCSACHCVCRHETLSQPHCNVLLCPYMMLRWVRSSPF